MSGKCCLVNWIFLVALLVSGEVYSQQHQVRGFVVDSKSGNPVFDATVTIDVVNRQVVTDRQGYFSLSLQKSFYRFRVERLGYALFEKTIIVDRDTLIRFSLIAEMTILDEVEVFDSRTEIDTTSFSLSQPTLSRDIVYRMPAMAGERDVLKSLSLLPGVQTGSEGSADLFVRGGTTDQNLLLLDQVPIYSSGHLFGFLSPFNPMAIDEITLHKSYFPAQYGGRLSSVIEARTVEPNFDSVALQADLGILSSKFNLEVPVKKNKAAFQFAGRRSVFDGLMAVRNLIRPPEEGTRQGLNFIDGSAKFFYKGKAEFTAFIYGDRDNIFSTYSPLDGSRYTNSQVRWHNALGYIKLKNSWGNLRHSIQISHSQNQLGIKFIEEKNSILEDQRSQQSTIQDLSVRDDLSWQVSSDLELHTGVSASRFNFAPARIRYEDLDTTIVYNAISPATSRGYAAYAGVIYRFGLGEVNGGIRATLFESDSLARFANLEPRLMLKYKINPSLSAMASFSRMVQPIHQLSNPGLGMPLNIWVSADNELTPEVSYNASFGVGASPTIASSKISINAEVYYKTFDGLISFKDGFSTTAFVNSLVTPQNWRDVITIGRGRAYGLELMVGKSSGNLTGWMSYAYGRTKLEFPLLNGGRMFNGLQDIPHQLTLVLQYKFTSKWSLNANWVMSSGRPVTIPTDVYKGVQFNFSKGGLLDGLSSNYQVFLPTERNSLRMKTYHRLDFSFSRKLLLFRRFDGFIDLGLYNAYNRRNPFYYYVKSEIGANGAIRQSLKSVAIFPLIPQISLRVNF